MVPSLLSTISIDDDLICLIVEVLSLHYLEEKKVHLMMSVLPLSFVFAFDERSCHVEIDLLQYRSSHPDRENN